MAAVMRVSYFACRQSTTNFGVHANTSHFGARRLTAVSGPSAPILYVIERASDLQSGDISYLQDDTLRVSNAFEVVQVRLGATEHNKQGKFLIGFRHSPLSTRTALHRRGTDAPQ